MVEMKPTRTCVIDCGRHCNVNCRFCYYHHLGDLRKQGFESIEKLKAQIDEGRSRGCDFVDITGGEPTIMPGITELIRYIKSKGMGACIITNAIANGRALDGIVDAGIDDFLISIHGTQRTHDSLVGRNGAREAQNKFIDKLKESSVPFRFNFVINSLNEKEIVKVAKYAIEKGAYIMNYINFNPHGNWSADRDGCVDVIADLRTAGPTIERAVDLLEAAGIGVNVRYFPMCMLRPAYRRIVCNDLHVQWDPYEWDYGNSHDHEMIRKIWRRVSSGIEEKAAPCCYCDLQWVCGGVNIALHDAVRERDGEIFQAVKDAPDVAWDEFYYRRHNDMTLGARKRRA